MMNWECSFFIWKIPADLGDLRRFLPSFLKTGENLQELVSHFLLGRLQNKKYNKII
jgi:hypothetical protein